MASKRIQEIVDRFSTGLQAFVTELQIASQEEASEEAAQALLHRLRGAFGDQVHDVQPIKRRKTTKGMSVLRPCPVPDCKETAAPRYQMVCKGHNETLSREEILMARDNAVKPGGAWFDLAPRPVKKAS